MEPIYNKIGSGYNTTRQADPYITSRLLYFLKPVNGKKYLDAGCGSGNYTIALAKHGLNFTGVEPSGEMLAIARNVDENVRWLQGTAEEMPLNDNVFDGAIATLTIHHWIDLTGGLKEINRVTITGGTLIIFTATPEQMKGYWLNYYFPEMLAASISKMPSFDSIENALIIAGFAIKTTEKYFIKNDLQDHFLYSGKHSPEIYLDEKMRKGISSFAVLANPDEIKPGLSQLRADIESGEFLAVKEKFDNDQGDYLFIVAQKE